MLGADVNFSVCLSSYLPAALTTTRLHKCGASAFLNWTVYLQSFLFNFAPTMIRHNTLLSSPCSPQNAAECCILFSWMNHDILWWMLYGLSLQAVRWWAIRSNCFTTAHVASWRSPSSLACAGWIRTHHGPRHLEGAPEFTFCFWDSIARIRPLGGRLISLLLYAFVLGRFTILFCVVGFGCSKTTISVNKDVGWFMGSAHSAED